MPELELTPDEALEQVRREVLAYVAEHYVPNDYDDDPDSMSDDEHVWHLALEAALGPEELWDRWEKDVPTGIPGPELDRIIRTLTAYAAVAGLAIKTARKYENDVRLFGDAAEAPRIGSSEWTALHAGHQQRRGNGSLAVDMLAFYLLNVRGGLLDATGAFHEYDDDDDEEEE